MSKSEVRKFTEGHFLLFKSAFDADDFSEAVFVEPVEARLDVSRLILWRRWHLLFLDIGCWFISILWSSNFIFRILPVRSGRAREDFGWVLAKR